MREGARKRGAIRWRALAVWWVVGTVVVVGIETGAVWWMGKRANTTISRGHGAFWLVESSDRSDMFSSAFTAEAGGGFAARGSVYPIWADINYATMPPVIVTADGSLDSLDGSEIRTQVPKHVAQVKRLRDVLGSIRRKRGWETDLTAIDVAWGVPVGMVVMKGWAGHESKHNVPWRVRAWYPVVITFEPGVHRVLMHWNAIWIGALGSAVAVGLGPGGRRVRRVIRRKRGACEACGYSLVGIASDAPCPECGNQR